MIKTQNSSIEQTISRLEKVLARTPEGSHANHLAKRKLEGIREMALDFYTHWENSTALQFQLYVAHLYDGIEVKQYAQRKT